MEPVISFSLSLNKLTQNEKDKFVSNAISRHDGTELFCTLLTNYFINHKNKIEPFANDIANIINSRKNKEKRQFKYKYIYQLPSVLIGECASYLNEKEYFRFSQSNQQIYVSVNKPLRLYKMSMDGFEQYPQSMSMHKFKLIKELGVDIGYFNQNISNSNKLILKQFTLNALSLSNNLETDQQFNEFYNKNPFNFGKIKNISLLGFGHHDRRFNAFTFEKLLSNLSKTEYLTLCGIYLTAVQFKKEDTIKWVPNLKHLSCYYNTDSKLTELLLETLSHQLETLWLSLDDSPHNISKSLIFPKLQQLALELSKLEQLKPFKSVKTLKKATLNLETSDKCVAEESITFLLKYQPLIEKIQIWIDLKHFEFIAERFESVLYDIRDRKKKELSIAIGLKSDINTIDDILLILKSVSNQMNKLLNMLKQTKIMDYIVTIRLHHGDSLDIKQHLINNAVLEVIQINQDYSMDCIVNKKCEVWDFIASNRNCKINGYGVEFPL